MAAQSAPSGEPRRHQTGKGITDQTLLKALPRLPPSSGHVRDRKGKDLGFQGRVPGLVLWVEGERDSAIGSVGWTFGDRESLRLDAPPGGCGVWSQAVAMEGPLRRTGLEMLSRAADTSPSQQVLCPPAQSVAQISGQQTWAQAGLFH